MNESLGKADQKLALPGETRRFAKPSHRSFSHNPLFQSATAGKPLVDLADTVRKLVTRHFRRTTDRIGLAFLLDRQLPRGL